MESNKELILTHISFFKKDMIIKDSYKHHVFFDMSGNIYDRISDLPVTELSNFGGRKDYYNVDDDILVVSFIADISNNRRLYYDESSTDFLISSFSASYSTCGLKKLFKDVFKFFNDKEYIEKWGKETISFILEFEVWSYYDSWAGDGDAGIEYIGLKEI